MSGRASQITDLQQVVVMIVTVKITEKKIQDNRDLQLETSLFFYQLIMISSLVTTRHHSAFLKHGFYILILEALTYHSVSRLDFWKKKQQQQNVRLGYQQ